MSIVRISKRLRKAVQLLLHPVYRTGLRLGIGAAIEHQSALRQLGLGTVIDVGANKGQFSLLTRGLFPQALIHAFEPLEEQAALYRRLFVDDGQVILHPVALGERNDSAEINLSGRADSSSLLPISSRQARLFPGTAGIGTRTVAVARGDDLLDGLELPKPLMIKLDVQGFELAALQGMPKTLSRADFVYVEISFEELYVGQAFADEIISFLRPLGFRLEGIHNPTIGRNGALIQADALFTRSHAF